MTAEDPQRMLRILMHCLYFPPEVGGLESHVFYLCRALVEQGHRVDVVTSRSLPGLPASEVMDGVRVHRTWFPGRNPVGWAAHALASTPAARALARSADIVHAQAFASVVPGLAASRAGGTPLVTTWHTSHFLTRAKKAGWRTVFRWMLESADHNLAASQEIATVAEEIAPGVRVEALTNGVETEVFRRVAPALAAPPPGRFRILVPRRLFRKNGVEFAVRALPAVLASVDAEMVLVGDGPERRALEALVAELGLGERVTFLGARPNHEMPALLSSADLAVFPSLMEATSVAALECMSCQVPVAASRVGGLPEIVDEGVGGLFEPADPDDLARTVVALLTDPDLPGRGRAGRARVEAEWSNARLALRHVQVYRALLAGLPPRAESSLFPRTP
ncbi:MAG: glycosyltransferase family 4 protein [Gemmatimonadales bacterium]|nr:MAG: glycosyltransferase family 4 protein [Gemmatimonadales bacterium]